MAAKKSAKKSAKKRAAPAKKAKKAAAKKASAGVSSKKKAAGKKKAAAKRTPPEATPPEPQEVTKQAKDEVSSMSVNLGHIYALRPRVTTSFRQGDFIIARRRLQEESFASTEEAARAVVDKALELTHESPSHRGSKSRRGGKH